VLQTFPNTAIAVRAAVVIVSTLWHAKAAGGSATPPAAVGNGKISMVSGTNAARPPSLVASLPRARALLFPSRKSHVVVHQCGGML
jgi:hypothetical protein